MLIKVVNLVLGTILIQIFSYEIQVLAQDLNCNPCDNCATETAGTKVPDPKSCYNYYICITDEDGNIVPSDDPITCNPGYYFYSTSGNCATGSCTNKCINLCSVECKNFAYERVADENSCSSFYSCEPGNIKVECTCPPNAPYFDGSYCKSDEFACCDTCVPYCEAEFTQVADPFNCKNYYFCQDVGIPSENDLHVCDVGEFFDSTIGTCQPTSTTCQSACKSNGTIVE